MDGELERALGEALSDPAPRPQVKRISPTHEAILNWLIANPGKLLRHCAAEFDVTQSWLSCIIHSDIFQAKLKQRQNEVFVRVADTMTGKLTALADVALEKMTQKVEESEDPKFIRESFDSVMAKLGYAPGRGAGSTLMQQNNFFVNKDDLAKARGFIEAQARPAPPTIEVEVIENAS